ncbi:hypothetical protein Goshw_018233 [Gossypium schwendimanii]|uniref:Uncharacterized protein n=1 Tax=Gossypium schwendimanii TaxID=34291 RepID=A0A7J9MTT3_GOSSC|nr:hypothetical protein [Gossypium schwendimanii]
MTRALNYGIAFVSVAFAWEENIVEEQVGDGYQYEIGERGGDGDEKGQFIHAVIESRKSRRVDGRIEGKDDDLAF